VYITTLKYHKAIFLKISFLKIQKSNNHMFSLRNEAIAVEHKMLQAKTCPELTLVLIEVKGLYFKVSF